MSSNRPDRTTYLDAQQADGARPLDPPLRNATMGQALSRLVLKAARFKGFATRSEFLKGYLAVVVIGLVLGGALRWASTDSDGSAHRAVIVAVLGISLLLILPTFSLTWRRLHDAGYAGPWYFIIFVPLGFIVLLVMVLTPSRPERHKAEWAR